MSSSCRPAAQSAQDVAPRAEYCPSAHGVHAVASTVGPLRYCPAPQAEHTPVSADDVHADAVYSPAAQVAQAMQPVAVELAPARNCPAAQSEQAPVSAESEQAEAAIRPAAHVVQVVQLVAVDVAPVRN